MKYRFCGDKLQLVKYVITTVPDAETENPQEYTAADEAERDELLGRFTNAEASEVDNSGFEWLNGMIFTQEQQRNVEVERAAELGEENYRKYVSETDPSYQILDLDMRVSMIEMGVSVNDV